MLEENTTTENLDGPPSNSLSLSHLESPNERVSWWLLISIIAIGAALRCYSIHENIWIDELHTAWAVSGNYSDLLQRARLGNNAPTYFFLVKVLTDSLGLHAWTVRLLSILAGCLTIPLTYWMARSWRCTTAASLLAAALVASDRNAIFYSVEARTYVLVQLVSLLHLFLFSRLLVRSHISIWIAWVLTGILAFQLHCTAALIFPAEVAAYFAARFLKHESKSHAITLALGMVVIGLGMIPSLALLREVAERRENWAMFIQRSRNPFDIVTLFPMYVYLLAPMVLSLLVYLAKKLQMQPQAESFDEDAPLAVADTFAGFGVPLAITACWLFVPLILAWGLTERDVARLFFPRYLVASSITLATMTALLVSYLVPGRQAGLWCSVLVLIFAICTISPAKYFRYGPGALAHSSENWREPIGIINDSDTSIPVVLYSGLIEADAWHDSAIAEERAYCEFPVRGLFPIKEQREVISLARRKPTKLLNTDAQRILERGTWLLIRATDDRAAKVQSDLIRTLRSPFQVTESHDYGRIHLRRLMPTNTSD